MRGRELDSRSSEWIGDMTVWSRTTPTTLRYLQRLRQGLRRARQQELTPRQQQLLDLYYDQGLTMPQIARQLGVNVSTVSRTIQRAKRRLYRCLRYAL